MKYLTQYHASNLSDIFQILKTILFTDMSIGDFSIELYEYQKKIIGDKQMFFRGFKMLVVIRRQATYTNKRIGERQTTCLSILITNLDINTLQ